MRNCVLSEVPKSSRSKKIQKLDTVFSKFIRRRDCGFGFGHCISCEVPITFNSCDCGHYEGRRNMSVRYDEKDCNAQCRTCNQQLDGNRTGYRLGLIEKIGLESVLDLEQRKNNLNQLKEFELEELIATYSRKLKEVEKESY